MRENQENQDNQENLKLVMELLHTWEYFGRIVYLTEIFIDEESKGYQLFYKSTGTGTHESTKGNICPHYLLKVTPTCIGDMWGSMPRGWIPKVYKYKGKFKSYFTKEPEYFPKQMQVCFNLLKQYEAGSSDLIPHTITDDPLEINSFLEDKYKLDSHNFVDWNNINVTKEQS